MKLYLAGPYAGKDKTIQGVRFVSGIAEIPSGEDGLVRYMSRYYQAYPEGSAELEEALENFGGREIYYGISNLPKNVSGNAAKVQPVGERSSSQAATDKSADASTSAGSAEGVAEGDGQTDTGLDLPKLIRDACLKLDTENADQWAANGMPTAAAIYGVCPQKNVSRKLISQHGLSRDDVRKIQAR